MTNKITRLKAGSVYLDKEDGEEFVCGGASDDYGDCPIINLDGSCGFSHYESQDYLLLADSILEYYEN